MLIKSVKSNDESEATVTDETLFNDRRKVIKALGFAGMGSLLATAEQASAFSLFGEEKADFKTRALSYEQPKPYQLKETVTPEIKATRYNNFYEFGTDKSDPYENSQAFSVDPWKLIIDGDVETPITLDYDDLFSKFQLEERIYRLRCVEAWSMVIPWLGFPLHKLIAAAKPLKKAKYVAFQTVFSPKQMPGQKSRFMGGGIEYPYKEGLRIDEATHPLAFLAVGAYGKTLPPQNGAPIRLVVPWKYGFKNIKSIIRIHLTDKQPETSWNQLASNEYGFYANVNPSVDHPRWSQAKERRITSGGLLNRNRIDTQMFNGYEEVAPLYTGLNLRKNY